MEEVEDDEDPEQKPSNGYFVQQQQQQQAAAAAAASAAATVVPAAVSLTPVRGVGESQGSLCRGWGRGVSLSCVKNLFVRTTVSGN